MLSQAYFGALKWLQTQINIGEGKCFKIVTRIVVKLCKKRNMVAAVG